nr:MAG TPA: hypothetical protein [Caudoviricetes sp.]
MCHVGQLFYLLMYLLLTEYVFFSRDFFQLKTF